MAKQVNDDYTGKPTKMSDKQLKDIATAQYNSKSAEEPQVLGQTLFDKLDALVTAIGNVVGIPTPTGPTPAPISSAPSWPAVTAAMAQVKLALSKKHRINE